jgi:hypothetical protein
MRLHQSGCARLQRYAFVGSEAGATLIAFRTCALLLSAAPLLRCVVQVGTEIAHPIIVIVARWRAARIRRRRGRSVRRLGLIGDLWRLRLFFNLNRKRAHVHFWANLDDFDRHQNSSGRR